ncbi:MAG: recombinase family protein [Patescibacteria group bacterium]
MEDNSSPLRKYCLYARKSTESDEKQAASIESQIKEMSQLAQKLQLRIVDIKRESHSAKAVGQRPVFNEMIEQIKLGRFNAILTWAPDRLSRNAGDLGVIVDLLDQKLLIEVQTYSQKFTDNPNEKFLLMILGAQGKLENDQKGLNVKRGMRAKCEQGLWPAPAPTGYLNSKNRDEKCHVFIDPYRGPVVKQMFERAAGGMSGRDVTRWLHSINFKTVNNQEIWLSSVQKILRTPFYYGEFEYPRDSGNWYKGIHKPLIDKELFMKVQEEIRMDIKHEYKSKEFAFTKLMKCGRCGSGVTAQEKFKKLKSGEVNKYIYYGCTRAKDINCPERCLREKDLVRQICNIIDRVNLDELGLKESLNDEVQRYHRFQRVVGARQKLQLNDVDMRDYAKYILREGAIIEKRLLMASLRDRLVLLDKIIVLAS